MNSYCIRKQLRSLCITESKIEWVVAELSKKERIFFCEKDMWIKVCIPKDVLFFRSLQNEIRIYENYPYININVPKLIYSYFNEEERICIIVTQKIIGKPIGLSRNGFCHIENHNMDEILLNIGKISELPIVDNWRHTYDRNAKIIKYANKVLEYIGMGMYEKIENICKQQKSISKLAFSHGDLIPTNIIIDNSKNVWFIDWEWATNRTKYYDRTLFLLFSDIPIKGFEKFGNIACDKNMLYEMYQDAVLISLRELKNWEQVKRESIKKQECRDYWNMVLKEAVECLM